MGIEDVGNIGGETMKHGTTSIYVYVKEAYHQSKKRVMAFIGALTAIWGVFNSLISQEWGWKVLTAFAVVGVVYAIVIYFKWLYRIVKGRMSNVLFKTRKVTLLRNGFPENMDILLNGLPKSDLENFAFVMGIDRSGLLDISTKGGVIYAVLKYLDENYQCGEVLPSKITQQQLNNYLTNHNIKDGLAYGTCVEINMNLSPHESSGESTEVIPCNLILVANSRKVNYTDQKYAETVDDDNKSNIIIPKVFDYLLHTNRFSGAMIGVMGTNGMRQTYQVIFSQTINQYARICYKDKQNPLTHLLISIRESDYSKWGMSLSQLGNYVRTCAKYYS